MPPAAGRSVRAVIGTTAAPKPARASASSVCGGERSQAFGYGVGPSQQRTTHGKWLGALGGQPKAPPAWCEQGNPELRA
jgi:hypothetical protein